MNWWLVAHHLKHGMMTVRPVPAMAGTDAHAARAAPAMAMGGAHATRPPLPVMTLFSLLALAAGVALGLLWSRHRDRPSHGVVGAVDAVTVPVVSTCRVRARGVTACRVLGLARRSPRGVFGAELLA
jgi:hypothetical protein